MLIQGLANAAQHNGKIGRVVEGGEPGPGRVGVKVSGGKVLAIKWDNLRACAEEDESRRRPPRPRPAPAERTAANDAPVKAGSPTDNADGGVARL